jgi:Domain of unknown function (DUF4350)
VTTLAQPAPPAAAAGRPPGPARAGVRWRTPLALAALVLLGGVVIALLQPTPVVTGYLDPASTGPSGAHALADLLAARGTTVTRVTTPTAAEAALGRVRQPGGGTLVITSPGLLTARELAGLAGAPGGRVLVAPDRAALAALAPGVTAGRRQAAGPVQPGCALAAARLAGNADMGGLSLHATAPGAQRCYPQRGLPTLVAYRGNGRMITVFGSGEPLTNAALARLGNAALALNLLTARTIVWLVPAPGAARPGGRPLTSLIPLPADLVALQLCIAVLVAAAWRGRRLGPLVSEPLPVVVRASETVEGHAGLYRARRARGRAAAELRAAMLRRVAPALGMSPDAPTDALARALTGRAAGGAGAGAVEAILFGPAPTDDAGLVVLADRLDALEREVRAQ